MVVEGRTSYIHVQPYVGRTQCSRKYHDPDRVRLIYWHFHRSHFPHLILKECKCLYSGRPTILDAIASKGASWVGVLRSKENVERNNRHSGQRSPLTVEECINIAMLCISSHDLQSQLGVKVFVLHPMKFMSMNCIRPRVVLARALKCGLHKTQRSSRQVFFPWRTSLMVLIFAAQN